MKLAEALLLRADLQINVRLSNSLIDQALNFIF